MTRTAEDARLDPKPGDVFRKGKTQRRVISRCSLRYFGACVEYQVRRTKHTCGMTLEDFIEWAADAEVLEVSE